EEVVRSQHATSLVGGPASGDSVTLCRMSESLLTHAISELGSGDLRTLLARTERSLRGRASELRPRLREAVLAGELAPEDLLRRLDEDALSALAAGLELSRAPKHQELVRALALAIER